MQEHKYKITAVIERPGGSPVNWTRFSKEPLTQQQCERMMSLKKEAGISNALNAKVSRFKCVKVKGENQR